MTIKDATPTVPPIPQTFTLGLDGAETAGLLVVLLAQFKGIPADAAAGNMSFCNIRFAFPPGSDQPTSQVNVQFLVAVAKKLTPSTPSVPAPAAAAAAPAPGATAKAA
jgi:hypothetical protein